MGRAGMRPGNDLLLPAKTYIEFQTECKHRFDKEYLADDNDDSHRSGEWQPKPDAERGLETKSLLGFERTSKDLHAPRASPLSKIIGGRLQSSAASEWQETAKEE